MNCIGRFIIQSGVKPNKVYEKDRSSNRNVPKNNQERGKMRFVFMVISSYSIFRVPS